MESHTYCDVELLDAVARALAPRIADLLERSNGLTVTRRGRWDVLHAHHDNGSNLTSLVAEYVDQDAPSARSGVVVAGLYLTVQMHPVMAEVGFAVDPDGNVRAVPGSLARQQGVHAGMPLDLAADHPMAALLTDLRDRFRAAHLDGAFGVLGDGRIGSGRNVVITYPDRGHTLEDDLIAAEEARDAAGPRGP